MTLKKVILLNPSTVRIISSHADGESITDVDYSTIANMDASSFATWAKANINPPVVAKIPSWLSSLEGTTI